MMINLSNDGLALVMAWEFSKRALLEIGFDNLIDAARRDAKSPNPYGDCAIALYCDHNQIMADVCDQFAIELWDDNGHMPSDALALVNQAFDLAIGFGYFSETLESNQ